MSQLHYNHRQPVFESTKFTDNSTDLRLSFAFFREVIYHGGLLGIVRIFQLAAPRQASIKAPPASSSPGILHDPIRRTL
jgi:hypothetical protein